MGKGSKRRDEDTKKFNENYDKVFQKKKRTSKETEPTKEETKND